MYLYGKISHTDIAQTNVFIIITFATYIYFLYRIKVVHEFDRDMRLILEIQLLPG
jgi:cbb3-type cytochrome oxidase subunit 3